MLEMIKDPDLSLCVLISYISCACNCVHLGFQRTFVMLRCNVNPFVSSVVIQFEKAMPGRQLF